MKDEGAMKWNGYGARECGAKKGERAKKGEKKKMRYDNKNTLKQL